MQKPFGNLISISRRRPPVVHASHDENCRVSAIFNTCTGAVHARTKAAKGGSPNMTMPFIYVFVSQLLTVIHGRISRRGRARSAGEVEVGDAAGEQAGRL